MASFVCVYLFGGSSFARLRPAPTHVGVGDKTKYNSAYAPESQHQDITLYESMVSKGVFRR